MDGRLIREVLLRLSDNPSTGASAKASATRGRSGLTSAANNKPMNMKNKTIKRTSWFVVCLLMTALKTVAQTDPHFTQNYTFPLYINPAFAGSSDGDYRASAIF